ncbi:MAG: hypothetical protein KDB84_05145, partial [Flavobacteriales bacterium]|nr:hypothetical protein [Flavobacteriales bacterium]
FMAPPLTANIFTGGNGRGDVSFSYSNDALVSNIYFGGNGRGDVSNTFLQAPLLSSIFSGGNGRGDVMNAYLLPLRVRLALKGFLEGPYDPTAGRMRDDLRTAGLIPTSEPYTALGYDFVQGGGEATTALVLGNDPQPKDRIVDWVVVELRDAMDPSIVVNSRSALIQRDGDVVDLDGFSALEITADPAPYHVALRHRNHLGAMTGSSYSLTGTALPIDLTSTGTLLSGTEPARVIAGAHALWAGDVTFDGTIKYTGEDNDRDLILQAIGGVVPTNFLDAVYRTEDVNMDGKVLYTGEDNDRDIILQNIGGVAPTNVREGTLP